MFAMLTTFLGFVLVYAASPRASFGLARRSAALARGSLACGLVLLVLGAAGWCRDLGPASGLLAWIAACSASGTVVILSAPLAPRAAVVAALAPLAAVLGGPRSWRP